jgi:hypothetical protein
MAEGRSTLTRGRRQFDDSKRGAGCRCRWEPERERERAEKGGGQRLFKGVQEIARSTLLTSEKLYNITVFSSGVRWLAVADSRGEAGSLQEGRRGVESRLRSQLRYLSRSRALLLAEGTQSKRHVSGEPLVGNEVFNQRSHCAFEDANNSFWLLTR